MERVPISNANGGEGDDDSAGGDGKTNELGLLRPEQLVVLTPVPYRLVVQHKNGSCLQSFSTKTIHVYPMLLDRF